VHARWGRPGLTERWPWVVAFIFGLLHGFGFASALTEVGLPQHAIPVALLFFNVGVEIGQLLFIGFVMTVIACTAIVTKTIGRSGLGERANVVAAYAIGTVAAFWLIERTLGFLT
jgi:hypothetical protein